MSHRRRQQLHRAGERAIQGRPSPTTARNTPPVPRPRTPLAAVRPATQRQSPARPGGNSLPSTPQAHGLDWARRIELGAVLLGLVLSSLIAAVGIWYSNNQVHDQLKVDREGQITDRYTKAVENLGNDAIDVRLGGVYALQRIMQDSPRDHPTIANVLATYVRAHTDKPRKKGEDLPADVHAALTVLVNRDRSHDEHFTLDLRETHLAGADLAEVDLANADLTGADLTGANLTGADLTDANLTDADLTGAHLTGAHLTDADLALADLRGAVLFLADLTRADLANADLAGADLTGADLAGAHLVGADLSGADLTNAHLAGADLSGADLSGADLSGADLSGADGVIP